MRICTVCKRDLELSDFNKNSGISDGYLHQCKECVYKRVKEYYSLHPGLQKERRKKIYYKNREENIKNAVEWNRKHKKQRKIIKDRWRAKNKEVTNHLTRQYNYRRKGAVGNHTIEEWKKLCESFDNRCLACGKKTKLTEDHIILLSKGGTDYIDNIQPLCVSCNSTKGNKSSINYKLNILQYAL